MWTINWVDRLNYTWTQNFVLLVWIFLGIVWLFKGGTTCSASNRSAVSTDGCLKNLYYLGPNDEFDPRYLYNYKKIDAYKDIDWFSFFVAIVCLKPFLYWFIFTGARKWYKLAKIIKELDKAITSSDQLDDEVISDAGNALLRCIHRSVRIDALVSTYLFLRLLYVGAPLYVLYAMSSLVGGDFFWPFHASAQIFPSQTVCYQQSWIYNSRVTTTCTHPMAGWYHLAFVIQWIWFAVTAVVNVVDLIPTFRYWNNPEKYEDVIRKPLSGEEPEIVEEFLKDLQERGIVIFTILYHNCKANVVDSLLRSTLKETKLRKAENMV